MEQSYDVAIIGGGPAGMSAALVLGRARKRVVVIDEGRPRNRVTKETHGFLTRDGMAPGEFRRIAREQLGAYPDVRLVEEAATSATGSDGDFEVTTASGTAFRCRKLLFAVGMKDRPVEIEGLADVYGKSAFVCPFCDGWELRDQPLALIARGARALHMAKMLPGWTERFAILTNGPDEWTDEQREEVRRHGIPVFDAPIRCIESEDGRVQQIVLEDGTFVPCTGIFFAPNLAAGSSLPQALGCQVTEGGKIVVSDPFGKTSVPGVYSAGDAATDMHQAIAAAAMGSLVAAGIVSELQTEAWDAAMP